MWIATIGNVGRKWIFFLFIQDKGNRKEMGEKTKNRKERHKAQKSQSNSGWVLQ